MDGRAARRRALLDAALLLAIATALAGWPCHAVRAPTSTRAPTEPGLRTRGQPPLIVPRRPLVEFCSLGDPFRESLWDAQARIPLTPPLPRRVLPQAQRSDVPLGALVHQLARHTAVVALGAAVATVALWHLDGCHARAEARARATVWGRTAGPWEAALEAPTARMRDSAIAAFQELADRHVLDPDARVRLARHLAHRLADTAADTRTLAVTAALDVAEPDAAAMHALRGAAAGVLAASPSAPSRFAALEVLARLGASPDDLAVVARTSTTDADLNVRALAATVLRRAAAP